MSQHVLFICESCQLPSDEEEKAGTQLLKQLQSLSETWVNDFNFDIQGVGCFCTCDHPCVIALTGANKPTYLFGDLPIEGTAQALLRLGELYADSDNGMVPKYQLPEVLKPARLARIPPSPII